MKTATASESSRSGAQVASGDVLRAQRKLVSAACGAGIAGFA
ncbi:MAG TPA: hypothetical protein VFD92_16550 [Candidatus Binatia bacterium]|nr:hypothetical protein [Candidatus Binatia bacterium]